MFRVPEASEVDNLRLGAAAVSPMQAPQIRRIASLLSPSAAAVAPSSKPAAAPSDVNPTESEKRKRENGAESLSAPPLKVPRPEQSAADLKAALSRINQRSQEQQKAIAAQRPAAEPIRLSKVVTSGATASLVSNRSIQMKPRSNSGGSAAPAVTASPAPLAQRAASAPALALQSPQHGKLATLVSVPQPPALKASAAPATLPPSLPLMRVGSNDLKSIAKPSALPAPTPQQRFEARMAFQQGLAKKSAKTKSAKITRDGNSSSQPTTKQLEEEEKKRRRTAARAEREAAAGKGNSNTIPVEQISPDQKRVIDAVLAGRNVFFTGSAGTGKSTLLRHLISILPSTGTFVTASTGMAAINIGGITLHQYAGIGLGDGSKTELAAKVSKSRAANWWRATKVLIIDEISMIDKDLFDKIEYVARIIRQSARPFGGVQLICCGDFFQLPPVSKGNSEPNFCFESEQWPRCIQENIELTRVFRQADPKFVAMLNEIRHGIVSAETLRVLKECETHHIQVPQGIEPTRLYPLNRDVDSTNERLLSQLPGQERLFLAHDEGPENFKQALQNSASAPTNLRLKVGAQVLLLKNLSAELGLANGARGIVIGFDETNKGYPIVRFINGVERTLEPEKWPIEIAGEEVAFRLQIPVKLGWALSIHKSQGLTLNYAEMALDQVFERGQAYVALSRVSSLAGLKLLNFKAAAVRAHPKVIEFYRSFDNFHPGGP